MDSGTSDTPAPEKIYDVPAEWSKRAFIGEARYHDMYACSVSDPNRCSPASRPTAFVDRGVYVNRVRPKKASI